MTLHSCMNAKCATRYCFSTFSIILILCRERWRVRDRQKETEGERKTERERHREPPGVGVACGAPPPVGRSPVEQRGGSRWTQCSLQRRRSGSRASCVLNLTVSGGFNRWGSSQVTSSRTALPSSDQQQPICFPITLDIFNSLFVFIQCTVLLGSSFKLVWLYFSPFVVTEKYFSFITCGKMSWTQLLRWDQVDVWCKEMRVHTDSLLMGLCCVFQDRVVRSDLAPLCCCYARCRSVSNSVADDWLWSLSTIQFLLNCEVYCLWHISLSQMFDNQIWRISTKSCVHVYIGW